MENAKMPFPRKPSRSYPIVFSSHLAAGGRNAALIMPMSWHREPSPAPAARSAQSARRPRPRRRAREAPNASEPRSLGRFRDAAPSGSRRRPARRPASAAAGRPAPYHIIGIGVEWVLPRSDPHNDQFKVLTYRNWRRMGPPEV